MRCRHVRGAGLLVSISIMTVMAVMMAGCAGTHVSGISGSRPGEVVSFLAGAVPGSSSKVSDELFGDEITVSCEESFISARSEECRLGRIAAPDRIDEVIAVCLGPDGWYLAPQLWASPGISAHSR